MEKCNSTPVDQTKFGKPDGNCFQACLASILNLPLDDVPHFGDEPGWFKRIEAWVRSKYFEILILDNSGAFAFKPDGYHIGGGQSPRGLSHACVFLDGKLIHDPHPSRQGIESVRSWYLLFPLAERKPLSRPVDWTCVCCKKEFRTVDEVYAESGCSFCFECAHRCVSGSGWPDVHEPWVAP